MRNKLKKVLKQKITPVEVRVTVATGYKKKKFYKPSKETVTAITYYPDVKKV